MAKEPEWESVCTTPLEGEVDLLERVAIPEGWLYRLIIRSGSDPNALAVTMTFVPRRER